MPNEFGFSDEFLARNASSLASVASGPSIAQVQASRPSLGADAPGVGPSGVDESLLPPGFEVGADGRIGPNIARIIGDALISSTPGRQAPDRAAQVLQIQQLMQARRTQNLENAARALSLASEMAKQLGHIRNPEARRSVRAQAESTISREAPELVPLFRAMAEHENLAFVKREEFLARAARFSPTAARWMTRGASPEELSDDLLEQMFEEMSEGEAREFIRPGRPLVKRLLRRAEQDDPERFAQLRESGGSLDTDEFSEILSRYADSEPDLNDPGVQAQLSASVERFPGSYDLEASKAAQKRRELREQKSIEAEFRQPRASQAVNIALPSGKRRRGRKLPNGDLEVFNESTGEFETAPEDAIQVSTQISGKADEVGLPGPSKSQADKVREAEINTRNFVQLAERTKNLFRGRPEILSSPGAAVQLFTELQASVEGFARLAVDLGAINEVDYVLIKGDGKDESRESVTPEEVRAKGAALADDVLSRVSDRFERLGIDRARIRSAVVGLAFAAAAAAGQTGRSVSDRDVERYIRRIGESANPETFEAVLSDVQEELITNFENTFTVTMRDAGSQEPPPDLRAELLGQARSRPTTPSASRISEMSLSEIRELKRSVGDLNSLPTAARAALARRLSEIESSRAAR